MLVHEKCCFGMKYDLPCVFIRCGLMGGSIGIALRGRRGISGKAELVERTLSGYVKANMVGGQGMAGCGDWWWIGGVSG
jgi:hypothetical protein